MTSPPAEASAGHRDGRRASADGTMAREVADVPQHPRIDLAAESSHRPGVGFSPLSSLGGQGTDHSASGYSSAMLSDSLSTVSLISLNRSYCPASLARLPSMVFA